jgi:hypothetical protein
MGDLHYVDFRLGDSQDELGLVDRRFCGPRRAPGEPGGALMCWHVDDITATFEMLLSRRATEYQAITPRGDEDSSLRP